MPESRYRVLAIATHPAQYQAPLFRRMAARADLDLHVAYCTLRGAEAAHDPEFGATVKWDIPLLDGYPWTLVPNSGSGADSFFGLRNSGLWKMIREGHFDAVLCYVGYVRASFWIGCFAAKFSHTAFLFGTDANTLTPRDGRMWKRRVKRIFWPFLFRIADQVIVPDVLVQAHSATLNLCFYTGDQFPAEYKGDIFAAFHGSWNRKKRTGYKIGCIEEVAYQEGFINATELRTLAAPLQKSGYGSYLLSMSGL